MHLLSLVRKSRFSAHLPQHTLRLRLTLLYGGFFLVSGLGLLAITYVLVTHATDTVLIANGKKDALVLQHGLNGTSIGRTLHGNVPPQLRARMQQLVTQAAQQHASDIHNLLVDSGIALGVMAVLSIGFGWLVAGRALRPLRTMTATARRISEHNLHERLALEGPGDEVKELADTIDGLLGRLEDAFNAQRRFVANAAHELRTPLTLERTLIEVALANPHASSRSLRETCERVLVAGEQHERLIESLLTLASSERGLDSWEAFDLPSVTEAVIDSRSPESEGRQIQLDVALGSAPMSGAPHLVERLVANLVDNALRYNVPGGRVEVLTGMDETAAAVTVINTGPVIPPEELERLFQPFQQLSSNGSAAEGHGLGLSIVHAIVIAHGALVTARSQPRGGLEVKITFSRTGPPGNEDRATRLRKRVNGKELDGRPVVGAAGYASRR